MRPHRTRRSLWRPDATIDTPHEWGDGKTEIVNIGQGWPFLEVGFSGSGKWHSLYAGNPPHELGYPHFLQGILVPKR